MKDKITLIIGDSTTLPRNEVSYYETWPYLLERKTNRIIENRSTWGNSTNCLKGVEQLELYKPDTIILQLGIVDCAPRLLSGFERRVLKLFPNIVGSIYSKTHKHIRKKSYRNAYVKIDKFKENISDYIMRAEKNAVNSIYILSILDSGYKYSLSNPTAQKSIDMYNDVLYECCKANKISEFVKIELSKKQIDDITLDDGFHYNEIGHRLIYNRLKNILCDS